VRRKQAERKTSHVRGTERKQETKFFMPRREGERQEGVRDSLGATHRPRATISTGSWGEEGKRREFSTIVYRGKGGGGVIERERKGAFSPTGNEK